MTTRMTSQEAINRVYQYFIVEKHPQANEKDFGCMYTTSKGNHCAIGCLIPEDVLILHDANINHGDGWKSLPLTITAMLPGNEHLLTDLQEWHDGSDFRDFKHFKKHALIEIARKYGLEYPGHYIQEVNQ